MDAVSPQQEQPPTTRSRGRWVAAGIVCALIGLTALFVRGYYTPSLEATLAGRFALSDAARLLLLLGGITCLGVGALTCVLAAFPTAAEHAVENFGVTSLIAATLTGICLVVVFGAVASHSRPSSTATNGDTTQDSNTPASEGDASALGGSEPSQLGVDTYGEPVVCFPSGCTQEGQAVQPPQSNSPCRGDRSGWLWERSGINTDGSDILYCSPCLRTTPQPAQRVAGPDLLGIEPPKLAPRGDSRPPT